MNIHFKDKELFKSLLDSTIVRIKVGSYLYGTNDENSDIDYLCIHIPTEYEKNNFFFLHHQLQYKEDGIDYIFTSLNSFIHNMINGDSTINFEALQSNLFENTPIEFLNKYQNDFINFSITRSYLGMARRDIDKYYKRKDDRDRVKGLLHIMRGYLTAKSIIEKSYNFKYINDILKNHKGIYSTMTEIEMNKLVKSFSKDVSKLREINNNIIPNVDIPKYMNTDTMLRLTNDVQNFLKNKIVNLKSNEEDILKKLYIDAFENGVTY